MKKIKNNDKKKQSRVDKRPVRFPANLLQPVGKFLQERLAKLEKTKKNIEEEDPFRDSDRLSDNAFPDTDAAEQFGHTRVSAIKKELDRKIIQTRKALTRLKIGKYGICENCGEMIDTDRLLVYPEATLCVKCQKEKEKEK
ncbi:MAG: Transcriptional regulator, TraR/DksA family [Candidatus Woesebacteria bacterium]|nr:MAG: Transcriptional regulator, TraR/DksA family [Candidatus Woesebacteria bacterium]